MQESTEHTQDLAAVQAFLAGFSPNVQAIAWKLRDLVLQVFPEAMEQIDVPGKLLGYGLDTSYKGTLCVIMPLKSGVNLGLARGAELPDPSGLLSGTGKRARHVRVANVRAVERPELQALLLAAKEHLLRFGADKPRARR